MAASGDPCMGDHCVCITSWGRLCASHVALSRFTIARSSGALHLDVIMNGLNEMNRLVLPESHDRVHHHSIEHQIRIQT